MPIRRGFRRWIASIVGEPLGQNRRARVHVRTLAAAHIELQIFPTAFFRTHVMAPLGMQFFAVRPVIELTTLSPAVRNRETVFPKAFRNVVVKLREL